MTAVILAHLPSRELLLLLSVVEVTVRSDEFAQLVQEYGERAYSFAYRLAGNETQARDLVQEAFTRAYEHRGDYDPARPFHSWLFRILQNIYLDSVRRYAARHQVSLDAPRGDEESAWEEILAGPDPEPIQQLSRAEQGRRVQQALEKLPIHYRTAVVLCDLEKFSYEEIAVMMKCPVGTVRSRIHQGRVLLRNIIVKEGAE